MRTKKERVNNLKKESQLTTVLRFEDGTYFGMFGKVTSLLDAIRFNDDWESQLVMKNNFLLQGEKYEVLPVQIDIQVVERT